MGSLLVILALIMKCIIENFHEKVRDRLKNIVETMKNRGRGKKQLDVL